jgi:hypothetical protein
LGRRQSLAFGPPRRVRDHGETGGARSSGARTPQTHGGSGGNQDRPVLPGPAWAPAFGHGLRWRSQKDERQ